MDLRDGRWMQARDERTIHIRYTHKHVPWPTMHTLTRQHMPTHIGDGSGIYFYLEAKSMWNAWWVMMMWRFEAVSWMEEPHMALSVRVITLLRLWLPFRERERESQTIVQLKLSGVNSAIITLKCQPAIKYNSSSGRKQISFDHAVITLSCRTIRRDQIFTFSVWGKAIRVHFTWQGCTFAILQG